MREEKRKGEEGKGREREAYWIITGGLLRPSEGYGNCAIEKEIIRKSVAKLIQE